MRRSSALRKQTKRKNAYWVFISYSTRDSWIAHVMKERIEALGAKVYIYEIDLAGGGVIVDEIIRGIDACHEAIVLVSPHTLQKPDWVIFEIGAIRGQHKRVTPILNNVDPEDLGPAKDIKGVDLNRFEQFLVQLRKRIGEQTPHS
jgi:predicted nucleotide-binding protein